MGTIPDRLEDPIVKSRPQDVLYGCHREEVVDAENLVCAALALAVLLLLVLGGPYPVAMVSEPNDPVSNYAVKDASSPTRRPYARSPSTRFRLRNLFRP